MDLIELNEAFAAQALACIRELKLDPARVNIYGGAIDDRGPLRELDAASPRVGRAHPGVLELPALRDERAPPERQRRSCSQSKCCTSTISGSRYRT